ncbi:MAG: ABC transporter substrate-binding protein, partial [Acidobacteria bacterium]|nr:ABC transporter substrate-binding protein [Acidobacteriota bacterium]
MTTTAALELELAHSPDSDDAFMFYGLRANAVDTEGLSYVHTLSDIETLNARALKKELAITAVSFHAYAYVANDYLLLPHGASFGDGYGPCVIA